MSSLIEQNPMNPQDPLHYAPRWLRERPEAARLSLVGDNAKAAERPASGQQQEPLDARLETAVFESLRQSLNPQVMREPPDLERERDRRSVVFKIAGRFAAATGVAAVVALFFVNIVPVWRQPDASSSFLAAVQSMKTLPPVAADVQDAKAEQTSSLPERRRRRCRSSSPCSPRMPRHRRRKPRLPRSPCCSSSCSGTRRRARWSGFAKPAFLSRIQAPRTRRS